MAELQALVPTFKYGESEASGANWQRWQHHADNSCPVLRARITIKMLRDVYDWNIKGDNYDETSPDLVYPPPPRIWQVVKEFELPIDNRYKTVSIKKKVRRLIYGGVRSRQSLVINDYFLQIGPGVLFALSSRRSNGPHWSEIALAAYRHYESAELRYVFRVDVVNSITTRAVHRVYQMNGIEWPVFDRLHWRYDTPEYRALLSTPNARGVAGLVIGGFESGTRYISEIVTWADPENVCLQMLFVISNRD